MSTTPITGTGSVLLKFEPHSTPDPARAGEKLMLRFEVNKPRETTQVFCDQITFQFDVDASSCTEPTYLATAPDATQQSVTPPDWDIVEPHDPGVFMFVRKGTYEVTKSYTFDIFDIDVSTLVGTATVTVTEHSTDHDVAHCPTGDHDDCLEDRVQSFDVPKFPPGFTSVDFKTDKTNIPPGGEVTLSWTVEKVASYQLLQDDDPIDPARFTHTTIGDVTTWSYTARGLQENTVFTLRVGYEISHTKVRREYYVPIDVHPPRLTLYVRGGRTTVLPHEKVTFTWDFGHVTSCSLNIKDSGGGSRPVKAIDGLLSCDVTPAATTTYFLSGTTEAGDTITSAEITINVAPPAPPASADLIFIQAANTASNSVEVHVSAGSGGFQQGQLDRISRFEARDGQNGSWLVTPESNRSRVLLLVKTRETAAGLVEVHWDPPSQRDYQGTFSSLTTPFTEADAANGTWQIPVMDNWSGPDVFLIRTATPGAVELLLMNSVEPLGYSRWITPFQADDGLNGTWLMGYLQHGTWPPDLAFIQTNDTASGQVEVSFARAADGYHRIARGPISTGFDCVAAGDGTWQFADMNGDGQLDLVFIRTTNTLSGRVEVHFATAADGFRSVQGGYTQFDIADGRNGTWHIVSAP